MDIINIKQTLCCKCHGEHWTSNCPWKGTMTGLPKAAEDARGSASGTATAEANKPGGDKHIPSRTRASKHTDNINTVWRKDNYSIRIENLSDSMTEKDLEDLVKPFGLIQKRYLAKDRETGVCKGFAYARYKFRNDAARAIQSLNGYGYNNLILSVDWSRPPTHST